MKIVIADEKHLFKESKKFYINFSFKKRKRNYILLYPCYWEFYCYNCLKTEKNKKSLENIAALLSVQEINEVEETLKKVKIFNDKEINDIKKLILTD